MTHVKFLTPLSRFSGALFLGALWIAFTLKLSADLPRFDHDFQAQELIGHSSESVRLEALDFTPEPGEIVDDGEKARFFERQDRLAALLDKGPSVLEPIARTLNATPPSLADHPLAFWIQILVGAGAFFLSAWIWAIRPGHTPSLLYFLSGVATLMFTSSSAIYTTRDLAIASSLFRSLTRINEIGASAFGILVIALFLNYPLRLKRASLVSWLTASFFGLWTLAVVMDRLPAWAGVNLVTLIEMVGICIAIGVQYFATKGKADLRASLVYLGLAVSLGAGFFIALNATPIVLGAKAAIGQEYAFLSFLLIYIGLAAGITRYRLFDVGRWGFTVLFYGLGAALLVALDGFLILSLGVERTPAFALSLFLVGLLYLPLRDALRSRFSPQLNLSPERLTSVILEVAFAADRDERLAAWRKALAKIFQPLSIKSLTPGVQAVQLDPAGLALDIPAVGSYPSLRLSHRSSGRALFDKSSVRLAQQLVDLLERAQSQREVYDKGAEVERLRMAQDLHDDIGSRLLSLMHSTREESRPQLNAILSDLRTLVSEMTCTEAPLAEVLADIRFETMERLKASGLELHWDSEAVLAQDLTPMRYETHKALRSGLRELISNVIRHSGASRVTVRVRKQVENLSIQVEDNGRGIFEASREPRRQGFGLRSLEGRIQRAQGKLQTRSGDEGFLADMELPLEYSRLPPRTGGDSAPSLH